MREVQRLFEAYLDVLAKLGEEGFDTVIAYTS